MCGFIGNKVRMKTEEEMKNLLHLGYVWDYSISGQKLEGEVVTISNTILKDGKMFFCIEEDPLLCIPESFLDWNGFERVNKQVPCLYRALKYKVHKFIQDIKLNYYIKHPLYIYYESDWDYEVEIRFGLNKKILGRKIRKKFSLAELSFYISCSRRNEFHLDRTFYSGDYIASLVPVNVVNDRYISYREDERHIELPSKINKLISRSLDTSEQNIRDRRKHEFC